MKLALNKNNFFYTSKIFILLGCLFLWCSPSTAFKDKVLPDSIRIVGSSTVFPFIALFTERLNQDTLLPSPIVESTGTGSGLKILCSFNRIPYIATASRPITEAERTLCKKNLQQNIVEYTLGLDGLILVSPRLTKPFSLTKKELRVALSAYVPNPYSQGKELILNPYKIWSDINPYLPNYAIKIYGPPRNAGLHEALVHLLFKPVCTHLGEKKRNLCQKIRKDGAYIEMPENSMLMLKKLQQDFNAIGIVSYRLFDQNRNRLQALPIETIYPSPETIRSKNYPLARKLYIYMLEKDTRLHYMQELLKYLQKEDISGHGGQFENLGLIPLK